MSPHSRRSRSAAAAVLFTALPLIAPALSAQQIPMHDGPMGRTITARATGTVQVRPDEATLLLAVETVAETAARAVAENAEKMERILSAVRGLGIPAEQVRTVSYHVSPVYAEREVRPMPQGRPEEPEIIGYRASNMVRVRMTDLELPGRVIDAGIEAGANRVAGLSFGIADPTAARAEALREAMRQARAEALAVAAAADQVLGEPVRIVIDSDARPMREMASIEMRAMDAPYPAPTPVEPGQLTVAASVTATFRMRSP